MTVGAIRTVGIKVVLVRVNVGTMDIAVGKAKMAVQMERRQLASIKPTGVSSKQVMAKL